MTLVDSMPSEPPATSPGALPRAATDTGTTTVEIVVPVYNESAGLVGSVVRLCRYLDDFPLTATVTIVDNASTDDTWQLAQRLATQYERVTAVHLARKGRGRALRHVWSESTATVVAYMDVDLATDLDALLPLLAPLVSGHSDVAIGTRLARASRVARGPKREFISRSYNRLLRTLLGVRFSDAQCGFKAVRADRVRELLPLVEDDEWFFDTELLILAERAGLRIHEVPVDWIDDPDSRVELVSTAWADVRGMVRVGRGLVNGSIPLDRITPRAPLAVDGRARLAGQVLRFAIVGVASTLLFSALYLLFRDAFGHPQLSSIAALLLSTVANTAANRRFTFNQRGRQAVIRQQVQGIAVLGIALGMTSGALGILHGLDPGATPGAEVIVLTTANLAATVVRFVLFRIWIFRPKGSSS